MSTDLFSLIDRTSLQALATPAHTALLIIDPQVDFIAPHGVLGRAGVDMRPLTPKLQRVQELIAAARKTSGATPIFIRVVTQEETDGAPLKMLNSCRGGAPDDIAICRARTSGANYFGVAPQPGEIDIVKPLYSAFAGTRLESILRENNIDTLVVCGFTTECCVDSTVRDAFHRGFHVILAVDACGSHDANLHDASLRALAKNFAHLTDTQSLTAIWESSPS